MRRQNAGKSSARAALLVCCLATAASLAACTSTSSPAKTAAPGPSADTSASSGSYSPTPSSEPTRPTTSATSAQPVPQPSKGNVHQTVPSRPVVTRAAASLHSAARFASGISARLTKVTSVQAVAKGPGEISGPAVALFVRITNDTSKRISLGDVVVNLADSTGAPGLAITTAPANPFKGSLASHAHADAEYVFTVPKSRRTPISVTVSYTATSPVVLFKGSAA